MIADVGMLDETFFMYYEDTDLSWRMRLRGWTVVYQPAAVGGPRARRDEPRMVPVLHLPRRPEPPLHDPQERIIRLRRGRPLWPLRAWPLRAPPGRLGVGSTLEPGQAHQRRTV